MWPSRSSKEARTHLAWLGVACAIVLGASSACRSSSADFHESDEVKSKPCVSCHAAGYRAATNPVHLGNMPETCQNCHATKAWAPTTAQDHPWWPLQNKHVGVSCIACHNKGFKAGDTPKDCIGCHRKSFDAAENPRHVANGIDVYPVDCAMCHTDAGFKPSPWKHSYELVGRHTITPCAKCHTGEPPLYKGTPTDCYTCHKSDADTRATAKNPNHVTFPHTCLNCHLMSGWVQGPPLGGLHPEAKFPILTGKHSDPKIVCLDCHKLEKGIAAGGANTDCIHCHTGDHVAPAIDTYHLDKKVPSYPVGVTTTNYCLTCHAQGQFL